MYFSASTLGFYTEDVHGRDIPADAVMIEKSKHREMMDAQSHGMRIDSDSNGFPIAVISKSVPNPAISCTPSQGLVTLFALKNITEDDVDAAIDLITDQVERYTAKIAFKHAKTWERNSKTMNVMAALLNLSDSDMDELFEYASTVQV